ncbi:D-Ala-D-Ala carboxypeptidase family metallohydrolase [Paracoccus hibiscisoli]|uniref:D-Ala-D-Ala carboxypeptidase family metallohydrolase n=1 Tax=Paracoccus hibiscisoli TaxID=2023261 RepID=UPI003B8A90F3
MPDLPPVARSNRVILALDLGTTTGWALHGIDGLITSGTASFRPGRFDGGGMRYLRFTNWLTEIDRLSGPVVAIWFEEVRRHAATDAAHVYGGLMATLTAWAELRGIPYEGVPVGTIKRHATGKGPEHNRAVGGATRSKHLDGAAFDIAMANHDPMAFEAAAREVGFLGFGFYPRSGFMHVDLGPARQWGQRFRVRATAFAAETPPAREMLADSRTMKGGGAAGVATLGAAGVEVAQSVLAETQTAILPLVPYLDTLRWVFIAVALGGIAVTIYARLDDWRRGQR